MVGIGNRDNVVSLHGGGDAIKPTDLKNVDVFAYVMWVTRESYLDTIESLKMYADKVKFYNEIKKRIREELKIARDLQAANTPCPDELKGDPESLKNGGPHNPHIPDGTFTDGSIHYDTPKNTTREELEAARRQQAGNGPSPDNVVVDSPAKTYTYDQLADMYKNMSPAEQKAFNEKMAKEGLTFTVTVTTNIKKADGTYTKTDYTETYVIKPNKDESVPDFIKRAKAEAESKASKAHEKPIASTPGADWRANTPDTVDVKSTTITVVGSGSPGSAGPGGQKTPEELKDMALQWEKDRKDPKNQTPVKVPKMPDHLGGRTKSENYGKDYGAAMLAWYKDLEKKDPAAAAAVRAWLEQEGMKLEYYSVEHDRGFGSTPDDEYHDHVTISPKRSDETMDAYCARIGKELDNNVKTENGSAMDAWDINLVNYPNGQEIKIQDPGKPPMPPELVAAGYVPGSNGTLFAPGGGPGDGGSGPTVDSDSKVWKPGQVIDTYAKLESYIKALEDKLNTVGDDAQLANVDLQNVVQNMQQTLQKMTNMSKTWSDTALAIIRHLGP